MSNYLPVTTNHRPQTAGTDVNALKLSINHDPLLLNVGAELTIGRTLRVTYIVSEHWAFAADFTFSHNIPLNLSVTDVLYQK